MKSTENKIFTTAIGFNEEYNGASFIILKELTKLDENLKRILQYVLLNVHIKVGCKSQKKRT